ncbi:MAG: ABC transporter substrate-binding protein [Candidatus Rokuibacteriota bacterium]
MPDAGKTPRSLGGPLSRRAMLRLGAALVGTATGPFVWTPARAQGFNWKRFQGKELFLLLTKHPWIEVLEKNIPEFESLSGMKVKWETLPEIQARQKLTVEMTASSGGVDAFFTSLHVEKKRFWKAGWYQALNKFLEDTSLTSPDYDWNDFAAGAKAIATQPDGTLSALPAFVDPWVLFYRKDLYAQKNWKAPATLGEMEQHAQAFHAPPGTYGIVYRGLKNANAPGWDWVLFSMGGNFLTKEGKASLDTKEAVAAMDHYAGLLRRFGPPGVVNFNWYECSAAFMQGQAPLYYDGVNFANQFEDPTKSKIAGKVGYAVLPGGPGGRYSPIFGTGVAVSSQSRSKEAAYLFAQWATNKQNAVRELMGGVGVSRNSPWNHPDVLGRRKMPGDWYEAYQESLKIGRLGLPEIVGVTEYRDIIGVAIQKAIEGAPSAQVLAQAQKEFQELLNKTEG